jgi:hypothetical protein
MEAKKKEEEEERMGKTRFKSQSILSLSRETGGAEGEGIHEEGDVETDLLRGDWI